MEARKDISYTTDATAHRRTDSPQRVHGDAADAEYKTDPSLEPIVVGTDGTSAVDRSDKAAKPPTEEHGTEFDRGGVIGGEGSRGTKGWTGSGKGGLEHEVDRERAKERTETDVRAQKRD